MCQKWLIIGISGVTCGGKTTLAAELNKLIPGSTIISQDDYFLDVNDSRHTWIPELNHINFDIITSLDMEKMYNDIVNLTNEKNDLLHVNKKYENIISEGLADKNEVQKRLCSAIKENCIRVLIVEGFCIFNFKPIADICSLKYYFTLTKEECYNRRKERIYEPPDCPGYFDKCAWPEYLKLSNDVKTNVNDLTYFDGMLKLPTEIVLLDIIMWNSSPVSRTH